VPEEHSITTSFVHYKNVTDVNKESIAKRTRFSPFEVAIIRKNWKMFCEVGYEILAS
jgi:hypothetical protein